MNKSLKVIYCPSDIVFYPSETVPGNLDRKNQYLLVLSVGGYAIARAGKTAQGDFLSFGMYVHDRGYLTLDKSEYEYWALLPKSSSF